MRIVILTENMANGRGLLAEHGLSVLVEAAGKRILFDTGQSDVYLRNAGELGESLEGLDGIVLSHGHYDHTEELPAPVFVRENAFEEKLSGSREKGTYRDIGIPWRKEGGEGAFGRGKLLAKGLLRQTGSLEEIFPDVWTVSGIRAVVPEEPVPEQFFLRRGDMLVPDLMEDEQLLVFHTPEGLAVFAGCAHLGILNCLERVKEVFPGKRLWLLLAGMHLRGCSRQRLEASVEGLRRCGFSWIIPLHCTGMEAIVEMRKAFGKHCLPGDAGGRYEL